MARVLLQQLVKTYAARKNAAAFTAVKGLSLEIADGEFMVLVGPSGCGKSTTLRMIAGLEDITSGTITIDDQVVNDVLPKDRDIAMVFQNYALYPHMTVAQNMGFGLKLRHVPRAEIARRVADAAALLGLESLLDRQPKELSGGQRQRVAVGRAIVRQPKVFLFDEPLSNLDAKMRVAMRTEIARLHARLGATMIYVTHDQVEAMTMGDRICVMRDGQAMQIGGPLELYEQPANLFVAGFIGSPPMNLFRGKIHRRDGQLIFQEANLRAPPLQLTLPPALAAAAAHHLDHPVVLGVRPEHVKEATELPAGISEATASVTVEVAEAMGVETLVHLTTGTTRFIARVPPTTRRYGMNQSFSAWFDLAHAHLFDPATEEAGVRASRLASLDHVMSSDL